MHPDALKRRLRHALVEADRHQGGLPMSAFAHTLEQAVHTLAAEAPLPDVDYPRLYAELAHEAVLYGPLWRLVFDADVSEVMVNAPDRVFCERNGKVQREPIGFRDANELRHAVDKLLSMDTAARIDQSKPWADLALPDGSRANITIPPIVHGGPHITLRKYQGRFAGVDDLVSVGTLDDRMAGLLVAAARARLNILFSGATGSGKTTLVEVLSRVVPHDERLVCIEDTMELHLDHPNVVRLLTREPNLEGRGGVTIGDLFRNALRMCPDRVLLGEIRGAEAYDYLQALNSGHDGSMAVLHASSPEEALVRLQNLVPLAGLGVPVDVVKRQIAHGLDLVVQIAQAPDGQRRVTRITEVGGLDDTGQIRLADLFRHDRDRDQRGPGRFVSCGHAPGFLPRLADAHTEVLPSWFSAG